MNAKDFSLKLNGDKVFLRYVLLADFSEMTRLYRESLEFYQGLINPPLDVESFELYVERNLKETDECFVICRQNDSAIVGAVNLSQIFRKAFQNCYLGYSLGVHYTGKGFMTEAVKLILEHVFENLKLHRIEANVQPHNQASIRVLERCGFSKEGFSKNYLQIDGKWCDHERWALVAEDWKK